MNVRKRVPFAVGICLSILLVGIFASYGHGVSPEKGGPVAGIGDTISDFSLPDVNGAAHSLSSLKGKSGTVLIFISVQCPISNAYNERMAKLAQDYSARGVNVVGINSNVTEPSEAVKKHAAEHQLSFPILKDNGNKIADLFDAQHTPEAFLLDANNKLVYRGRIDNAKNESAVSSNDLRDAMDEVLAGKPVSKSEAKAFGCSIKRVS
jgi:peroxiredoxin